MNKKTASLREKGFVSLFAAIGLALFGVVDANALTVTGYSSAVNDRFESGFPTAPVENSSSSFIGKDYDWSGVGWSTSDTRKGFGFISPQHYLVASHFGGGATIALLDQAGNYFTASQATVTNTGFGIALNGTPDLSIGRLTVPVTNPIPRYAVLDLNASSTNNSSYAGQPVFIYGRGAGSGSNYSSPRIADGSISSNTLTTYGTNNGYMTVKMDNFQFETGDSGSPAFIKWTNPNGGDELTLIGNNAAFSGDDGILNFIGRADVMNALNSQTTPDGFALKIRGNPARTWVGSSSTDITARGAWGLGNGPPLAGDDYVLFNRDTAGNNGAVTVDSNHTLRGLYFKETSGANAFTFGGSSTLTIGRGGITNYDDARQVFNAPVALGDHQYWEVGSGGVTLANVNTNGRLLEIAGLGTAIFNGTVSGAGGLAISGQRTELHGNNTYTGNTWIHSGRLHVTGDISSSSAIRIGTFGSLSGTGVVSTIYGSGSVHPGQSPGILTASAVNLSEGLNFFFEFTQLVPEYGSFSASGNDVLYLTDTTPFIGNFSAANDINIFLNLADEPQLNSSYEGGFFVVVNPENLSISISDANFNYYIVDPEGSVNYDNINYRQYDGPLSFSVAWAARSVLFQGETESVDGYSLKLTAVPEPASLLLPLLALLYAFAQGRIRLQGRNMG
jgi:hypothetical protein